MKETKLFLQIIFTSKLIVLGIFIYLFFYISALKTHWADFFFFGSSIHYCCQGLDFYQIPNGVYAFLHGGSLDGSLPSNVKQYSGIYATNINVYHPLFTLILGYFFIFFNPNTSIYLWMVIKIFITIFTVYYIYQNFKENKFLNFAIFIFLINFSQYNDIRISQYQFLLNIFLVFFLINLARNYDKFNGGIIYFLTLLAKPIGLLWAPVFLIKKQFQILIVGLSLFIFSTITFNILGVGEYFTNNLLLHLTRPLTLNGIDFMSLDALLRNGLGISKTNVKLLKFAFLGFIYLLSFSKKINIVKLIFLLIVQFLFFYDLVFQYHFSILGPILTICLLSLEEFQSKVSRILILIISLPNIFFILRIFNLEIINSQLLGKNPTQLGWEIVSAFQLLPILLLTIIVLIPDLKYYLRFLFKHNAYI